MRIRLDKQDQGGYSRYIKSRLEGSHPSKIKLSSWHCSVLLLLFCSPLIFFLFKFGMYLVTARVPGYISLPHVEIRANEDGYVSKVVVKLGERIKAGDFLCQLDQPELKKKESLLQSELDYLRQNPTNKALKNTTMPPASLELAIKQKNQLKKRLDDILLQFNRGAATESDVKIARFQYEQALARFVDLNASLSRAKDTTLMMQSAIESQEELRLKELDLESKKLALQAKALSVYSPIPGKVAEILAVEGNYVSRGDHIFTVTKNEKAYISAYLSHDFAKYSRVGQLAQIAFTDGSRIPAKVVRITKNPKAEALSTKHDGRETMVQLEFTQPTKIKLIDSLPVEVLF